MAALNKIFETPTMTTEKYLTKFEMISQVWVEEHAPSNLDCVGTLIDGLRDEL
jgi:hypothetical protein